MSSTPQHTHRRAVPGGLGEVLLHDDLIDPVHPVLPLHPPPLRPGTRNHLDHEQQRILSSVIK